MANWKSTLTSTSHANEHIKWPVVRVVRAEIETYLPWGQHIPRSLDSEIQITWQEEPGWAKGQRILTASWRGHLPEPISVARSLKRKM